ncbi:hypothetical protein [Pandoraea sp. SD6-2]|uniref:hypothetical protein n=1 Tax=Pandoraea sp. SD6-2 TaxID=1286093 RepID=UPI00032F368A|nr:hypothetical protein [Pandoraea sp. SD6-2]EON15339.1 hypothetical protein C266_02601 [Pandoraea sp. SD6-2]
MQTTLVAGKELGKTDAAIVAFLAGLPPSSLDDGKPMVIGIKNDPWDVYRTITTFGMFEYVQVCNFLETLGLVDFLDTGETVDGLDSMFGTDD